MKPTEQETAFAADVRARDRALAAECTARGFPTRNGTSYPSDTVFSVTAPTNEERSRAETIEFRANPPSGSYLAYLTENKEYAPHLGTVPRIGADGRAVTRYIVTTWTGEKLAEVVSYDVTRKVRTSWLTNERGSFWARGIDGRLYHGRHNGPGLYCRMRLAKNQKPKE
jgi:hypothetical protein